MTAPVALPVAEQSGHDIEVIAVGVEEQWAPGLVIVAVVHGVC